MNYSITMTVSPKFEPIKIVENLSQKAFTAVEMALNISAGETVRYIQDFIIQNSRRGSGRLAKSIDFYPESDKTNWASVGIGKISELPKYYYIINYGGFTTAAAEGWTITGGFDGDTPPDPNQKGTGVGSGRWNTNGMFAMRPGTEIYGKHYIQAGEMFLRNELNKSIKAVLAQLK